MRFLGFLVFVAAIVVGVIGYVQREERAGATRAVDAMEQVSADGLLEAKDGDEVIVEGRVADGELVTAPISEDEVAWWQVERILHQQVESQDCTGDECRDVTRQVLSELGVETADRLEVQVGGTDGVVVAAIVPNDAKATAGLRRTGSGREEDASGSDGWVEAREYALVPGDRVTLAGARHGDRDAPTLHKVDGVALVHGGTREGALDRLGADLRRANMLLLGGLLGALAGIALFIVGRRRARARRDAERRERAAREAADLAAAEHEAEPETAPEPAAASARHEPRP